MQKIYNDPWDNVYQIVMKKSNAKPRIVLTKEGTNYKIRELFPD